MADLRESLTVHASADVVYDLIADLPRMGEWSPECERVTWRGRATGPAEGAKFIGYNKAGVVRWITQGEVVKIVPGRNLAFEISLGLLRIARWEYFVVPDDADPSTCTVVEEWTDQRPLWYRAPADRLLGSRMTANQAGIVTTLANLKVAAETVSRKKTQPDR